MNCHGLVKTQEGRLAYPADDVLTLRLALYDRVVKLFLY
jgi:hypothetical protein